MRDWRSRVELMTCTRPGPQNLRLALLRTLAEEGDQKEVMASMVQDGMAPAPLLKEVVQGCIDAGVSGPAWCGLAAGLAAHRASPGQETTLLCPH